MVAEVYIDGIEQVQNALGSILLGTPEMTQRALRAGGAVIGAAMERRAPELSDEMKGTLARSIHMRTLNDQAIWVGTVHGLAPIFEFGGEITPTKREYLRFLGEAGEIYMRQVTIPAQPWLRPAVDESRSAAQAAIKRSAERSLKRLAA